MLAQLAALKAQLIETHNLPERKTYAQLSHIYTHQRQQLTDNQKQQKVERDRHRVVYHQTLQGEALTTALAALNRQSRADSRERRRLKQIHQKTLAPLQQKITQADQHRDALKQQYQTLSRQLQDYLQTAYRKLILQDKTVAIENTTLGQWMQHSCDRTLIKLLYHAVINKLQPRTMLEIWPSLADQQKDNDLSHSLTHPLDANNYTNTYKMLQEVAQRHSQQALTVPITPLPIIYQDDALIVVDKPAGLLSVPGRRYHQQDSVLSRLRHQLPNCPCLKTVHRLDQATSGLLIIATSDQVHRALSQQFAQRQVHKTYEAVLTQPLKVTAGTIELPLGCDPDEHPKQSVNFEQGKPSTTDFKVLTTGEHPRVRFIPQTGRTHQIRVHAAHPQGLNSPILGDSLYGQATSTMRLHLHATALELRHPITHKTLEFNSDTPF